MLLKNEGAVVSEKSSSSHYERGRLFVKQRIRRKYNSYKGEITPAVENLIDRDSHEGKPNQK